MRIDVDVSLSTPKPQAITLFVTHVEESSMFLNLPACTPLSARITWTRFSRFIRTKLRPRQFLSNLQTKPAT